MCKPRLRITGLASKTHFPYGRRKKRHSFTNFAPGPFHWPHHCPWGQSWVTLTLSHSSVPSIVLYTKQMYMVLSLMKQNWISYGEPLDQTLKRARCVEFGVKTQDQDLSLTASGQVALVVFLNSSEAEIFHLKMESTFAHWFSFIELKAQCTSFPILSTILLGKSFCYLFTHGKTDSVS